MRNVKTNVSTKANFPVIAPLYVQKEEVKKPVQFERGKKVALPTMEGYEFEDVKDIISLSAQGNYTELKMTGGRTILVCKTLRSMENALNNGAFVRIHRSSTINLNLISKYVKGNGGYVVMEDGSTINVSAGKKKEFMDALRTFF